MLEGSAEDEEKRDSVPEGHCFTEYASQRGGCLRVGAVAEFVKLGVNEGGDGELVARHEPHDGGGGDVVSGCHSGIGCSAIVRRIVKWSFKRSFQEWHTWFLTRDSRLRWKGWMSRHSIRTLGRRFIRMFRRNRGASGWNDRKCC